MPIRVTSRRNAPPAARPTTAIPFGLPAAQPGTPQKPPGISLCMIVKNEERFLAQCLRSVADVVDEIIIVDTGSTDRTIEIAKEFNAIVLEREWRNDFAWARNESIKTATKRWILFLDADEELVPESKPALQQLKDAPATDKGVWVRCHNRSDDYRGTGAMSHALTRIFPNSERIRFRGRIHEFPSLDNSTTGVEAVVSPISIVHHGYLKDIVAERKKGQRNLDIVKAATEEDPTDSFHWFNLGTTAFLVGDYELARDALEEMRRINGDGQRGFIPNGYAILAEVYADKLGDPIRGEEVARLGLKASPHYANAHFQLGKALIAQKRFEEARDAYKAAIEDGAFARQQFVVDDQVYVWKAHSEIGSSYVAQGDNESAADWFARGLANAPEVHPLQVNYARALDRLERFDAAEAAYRKAFETHRDDVTAVDFVNFLLRQRRLLEAIEIVDSVYTELTESVAIAVLTAAAKAAQSLQLPDAERYLLAAAERAPGNAEILNQLEPLLRARGDTETLSQVLEREAQVPALTPADWLRRSYSALAEKHFVDAVTACEAGIAIAPNDELLHYNAALALANLSRKSEALEHLSLIASKNAAVYVRAELLRAAILRELGQPEEALASLDRLLSVDAVHIDALLMRAAIYESGGNLDGAETTLQRAFSLDKKRAGVELAGLYLRAGRLIDAGRVAETALTA